MNVQVLGMSQIKLQKNQKYIGDWESTKKERETQQRVLNLFHSAPMVEIFKLYDIPLFTVYNYFASIDLDPFLKSTSGRGGGGALGFRNFFVFANQFGLLG